MTKEFLLIKVNFLNFNPKTITKLLVPPVCEISHLKMLCLGFLKTHVCLHKGKKFFSHFVNFIIFRPYLNQKSYYNLWLKVNTHDVHSYEHISV